MKHPAKMWPTRWLFHDRSEQPASVELIDVLMDIRNLLVCLVLLVAFT